MGKKVNPNDAAILEKVKVLKKLRDNNIRTEKDLQNISAEEMLLLPDVTIKEMATIIELQKSVKTGHLFSYLVEAAEVLIPESVSGAGTNDSVDREGFLWET